MRLEMETAQEILRRLAVRRSRFDNPGSKANESGTEFNLFAHVAKAAHDQGCHHIAVALNAQVRILSYAYSPHMQRSTHTLTYASTNARTGQIA